VNGSVIYQFPARVVLAGDDGYTDLEPLGTFNRARLYLDTSLAITQIEYGSMILVGSPDAVLPGRMFASGVLLRGNCGVGLRVSLRLRNNTDAEQPFAGFMVCWLRPEKQPRPFNPFGRHRRRIIID
jgi:hypothetical protein